MSWLIRRTPNALFSPAAFLVLLIPGLSCHRDYGLNEAASKYSIDDPAHVPIVLIAEVTESGVPVGPVRESRTHGQIQLWRARLQVENVLQGDSKLGKAELYYFRYDTPGSVRRLSLLAGERDVLFLMREGGKLRTICDAARNCCSVSVMTGAHPDFRRAPNVSINQEITDLLLRRGIGIDDKEMISAVDRQGDLETFGKKAMVRTLLGLANNETAPVREAACESLRQWKEPCTGLEGGERRNSGSDCFRLNASRNGGEVPGRRSLSDHRHRTAA